MTWLPSLRYGEHRWWLPLTATAASHWSELALRASVRDCAGATQAAARLLREDLPTRLWCAIGWSLQHALNTSITLALSDAATWLTDAGLRSWLSHDRLLGAPNITPEMRDQWSALWCSSNLSHHSSPMETGTLWLRITGPEIPEEVTRGWPTIDVGSTLEHVLPTSVRALQASEPLTLASLSVPLLVRQLHELGSLQHRFQQQLQVAKTESIYHLAYGLSHEINNPLSNISGRAQTLLSKTRDAAQQRPLQAILDQTQRGFEMIADLMYVARPPEPVYQQIDFADWFQPLSHTLSATCQTTSIGFTLRSPAPNGSSVFDPQMLGDAVRAVVRNSVEAMDEGGEVHVWADHVDGTWSIHIADNGPGIPDAIKPVIFEPYFSGRDAGRGLGMGLCKARRIMELHQGTIELVSCGPGCHVRLQWPRLRVEGARV